MADDVTVALRARIARSVDEARQAVSDSQAMARKSRAMLLGAYAALREASDRVARARARLSKLRTTP